MKRFLASVLTLTAVAVLANGFVLKPSEPWSDAERRLIGALSLSMLPDLPPDPSNAVADDPAAAALGEKLFFDTRLSADGTVACASCHQPDLGFQDGLPLGQGVGVSVRRTMPLAGMAYSPWLFWDGRADSLWAQALGPLENPLEHGTTREHVVAVVFAHYAEAFEAVFGAAPEDLELDRAFANVGKAIAAYERTLMPTRTRFDDYADAIAVGAASSALNKTEKEGLALFIGKAGCINCHNGPLFSDHDFHNTGVPQAAGLAEDRGRTVGAVQVLDDPFNCLGPYSDAAPDECVELSFIKRTGHELERAFKTPSLRGAANRAPYMHAGQIATLDDVIEHYNAAPEAPMGHSELRPIGLTKAEKEALMAFLGTLVDQADDGR